MLGYTQGPCALTLFGLFFFHIASAAPRELQDGSHSGGADDDNTPPSYSLDFMKELCRYVGVSYVRNPQDPLCKYVWCWNGFPFTMECSPGRTVHPYFYWSERDPCTEPDTNEQCLLRVLKRNTWIPKIERAEEPHMLFELDKNPFKESVVEEVHLPGQRTGRQQDNERSDFHAKRNNLYVTMSPLKVKQMKITDTPNRKDQQARAPAGGGDGSPRDPSSIAVSMFGNEGQEFSKKDNAKFHKNDQELNTGNIYLDSKNTQGVFNTAREYLIQDDSRYSPYY